MPKTSALPEDTLPTLDDFTVSRDTTSTTLEQAKWSNVLKMMLGGIYPVGCIYAETTGANPGTTFGIGTWTAFAAGRTLIGAGTSDQAFTAGNTGGESNHQISWNEMPSHSHGVNDPGHRHATCDAGQTVFTSGSTNTTYAASGYQQITWGNTNTGYSGTGIGINSAGADQAHNNLPPYIVVYFWKRTA